MIGSWIDPMIGMIAKPALTSLSGLYSSIEGMEPAEIIGAAFVSDHGDPSAVGLLPHTGNARFVVAMEVSILAIFFRSDDAQISDAIVGSVMRYVVDLPVRHLSVDIKPCQAMSSIRPIKNGDDTITKDIASCSSIGKSCIPNLIRPRPRRRGIVVARFPCEDPCFGVIVEEAFQLCL